MIEDQENKKDNMFSNKFENMYHTLNIIRDHMTVLQKDMKDIEKKIKKNMKTKEVKKKETKKRQPSGFAKPTKVTNELCEFMNRPVGTEIARTEVTKTLVQYIKDNELQRKNVVVPDQKLYSLLGLNNEEASDLTFFNIQKYMNKHFKPDVLETEQCK